jgi:hypothetical protein
MPFLQRLVEEIAKMEKSLEKRTDPATLQGWLDRQALLDLVHRYCRACDRRRFEDLADLYHADAIDDHGDMFRGPAPGFIRWLPGMMANFEATRHSISNALFAIEGDRADGELHAVAYHRTFGPDAQEIVIGGRYLDNYERRGDGIWRFAHRSLATDWVEVRRFDEAAWRSFAAAAPKGAAGPDDPSFQRLPLLVRELARPRG